MAEESKAGAADGTLTGNVASEKGVEENVLQVEDWKEKWQQRQIGFHMANVNESLEKHINTLVTGRQNLLIFVPLCGKTVDMKWLADLGHTVVGVEVCEDAIKEFFEEQKLEFTVESADKFDGRVFKSRDEGIRVYHGDLFRFNRDVHGEFDGIWDRASLVAINRDEREKYSKLMLSLMSTETVYLLDTLTYDRSKYGGPPHSTTLDEVRQLYGSECSVEEIEVFDAMEDRHRQWGIDTLTEHVIVVKRKQ